MQILDKAITPDGIEIELRDLSGEHSHQIKDGMHKKEKNFIHVSFVIKITHQIC